jgi:hypothetical protein
VLGQASWALAVALRDCPSSMSAEVLSKCKSAPFPQTLFPNLQLRTVFAYVNHRPQPGTMSPVTVWI